MAEDIGVHKNTYARWERGETGISEEGLIALVRLGWNANWVLTGEGPERAVDHTGDNSSQSPTVIDDMHALKVALEAVETGLAESGRVLPPDRKAELVAVVYELRRTYGEVPTAQVVRLIRSAA